MSKITTEDCKDFLINHFKKQGLETIAKEWKRASKYKEGELIQRDFSHPTVGIVVVTEDKNGLYINGSNSVKIANSEYVQKDFTPQEKKEAKKLLAKYISRDDDSDDEDSVEKLMKTDKWIEFQHALPSQFYFCFPNDTYHNHIDNVSNGLDTPMIIEGEYSSESFNVIFTDKNGSDIDLYASESLKSGVLPDWTDFCDEYHLEFNDDAPKITIREWFKMLLQMGFEYRDDDCLFAKELKKIKAEKSFIANSKRDESLKKDGLLKAIFKFDNTSGLKSLINDGLDINMKLSGGDNLLVQAYKDNAENCLNLLLSEGANIWLPINGDYCIATQMMDSRYSSDETDKIDELEFLLTHMEKQLPNDDVFGRVNMLFANAIYSSQNQSILDILYNFISKVLPEEKVNQVILNNMEYIKKVNSDFLIQFIDRIDEESYKLCLVKNLSSAHVVIWALKHRNVDITKEILDGDNVVEFLQKKMDELKETIEKKSKGFMLVFINKDGTQEYEVNRFIKSYNETSLLLTTIQSFEKPINKPKYK